MKATFHEIEPILKWNVIQQAEHFLTNCSENNIIYSESNIDSQTVLKIKKVCLNT
jgi:hypothetical protein